MTHLRQAIEDKAREIGFDAVGFAPVHLTEREGARLHQFVANSENGDMGWMAERLEHRSSPQGLWPEVKSVIVLGTNYGPAHNPLDDLENKDRAVISVYARNRDYHDLIKKRLKQLARWLVETNPQSDKTEVKVFVDTAPVMEKPVAAKTTVGWQGKHTNLVSKDFGSWLFLGEVFTTLDLAPDAPHRDQCGSCTACQDICPTDAFPEPYKLDARRCISYLTIEHKGHIPEEFREAIGNRIYGCDDCLAVCPWNKFASRTKEDAFLPRAELTAPRLADFLDLDDAGFRSLFTASPIKRIGRDRFLRNVLIGIGNSGDASVLPMVIPLLEDESELVREMAGWAVGKLNGLSGQPKRRLDHL